LVSLCRGEPVEPVEVSNHPLDISANAKQAKFQQPELHRFNIVFRIMSYPKLIRVFMD
jgi:hypothetical protein